MSLNRLFHLAEKFMVRSQRKDGKTANLDGVRVQLIPITDLSVSTEVRSKKIHKLVVDIILLAHKRGRPRKTEREFSHAA